MSSTGKWQENPPYELALLGLLAGLWGSSYLLIKMAVTTIPPITLIALRVSIAAAFLLMVMRYQGARFPKEWSTWRMLLIQAFFNSIASWTVLAWGQQYVDSGLAGVLNSTSPIFVFFITLLFTRHEAASTWKLAGTLLGVTGVVLIVGLDALRGIGQQIAGQFAILLGALLYAGAAIHGKRFSSIPPTVTAAGTMIWATVCLGPLSLAVDRPWGLSPSASSIVAAVVLGLFCTGVALLLYFRLVRTIGSMGVASQSYLRAGVSVLLGIFVLGEQINQTIGLGLAAIILGVAAINIPTPGFNARRRSSVASTGHSELRQDGPRPGTENPQKRLRD
jgi:drug/metabolite transporter (DMT)-like permease